MKYQPRNPNRRAEKREIWRSKLDKPVGPGMLVTLVPTLIMCVFLVMAAPYLKSIVLKFFELDKEQVILPIEVADDALKEPPPGPPPPTEQAIAEIYQRRFDAEGFDWRTKPEIEFPEEAKTELAKELRPVEVEIPLNPQLTQIRAETLEGVE